MNICKPFITNTRSIQYLLKSSVGSFTAEMGELLTMGLYSLRKSCLRTTYLQWLELKSRVSEATAYKQVHTYLHPNHMHICTLPPSHHLVFVLCAASLPCSVQEQEERRLRRGDNYGAERQKLSIYQISAGFI